LSYIAIIPARGGSKGIIGKNTRLVAGEPMVAWTLNAAIHARSIDRCILTTDDPLIADIGRDRGVSLIHRPSHLAGDSATTESAMLHVLEEIEGTFDAAADSLVLLQPTSPLRNAADIDEAVKLYEHRKADSLLSVAQSHHFYWKDLDEPKALYDFQRRPRRQDMKRQEKYFKENGAIYISRVSGFLENKNRLFGSIAIYPMLEKSSIEIDEEWELEIADFLLKTAMKVEK